MDETYDAKRTGQNSYNPDVISCLPRNCPLKRNSFPSLSDILEQEKIKREALELLRDTIIALKEMREGALPDQKKDIKKSDEKLNRTIAAPKVWEVSVLSEEEIETFMEPLKREENRKIFDYLAEWRRDSLRSKFVFDYRAVA